MPVVQVKARKTKDEALNEPKHTLVSVHMQVEQKEEFRAKAEELGQSLSGFFIYAAEKVMHDQERKNALRAIEAENKVLREEVARLQARVQTLLEEKAEIQVQAQTQVSESVPSELTANIKEQLQRQKEIEWEMTVFKATLKKLSLYIRDRDKTINSLLSALKERQAVDSFEDRKRHYQNSLEHRGQDYVFPIGNDLSPEAVMADAHYYRQMQAKVSGIPQPAEVIDDILGALNEDSQSQEVIKERRAMMQRRAGEF